jgi:squalene synthase HpnC
VAVIYAYARTADDLADEGDHTDAERIALLEALGNDLDRARSGQAVDDPVIRAAARIIRERDLPPDLFHDLLTAFRLDVTRKRYRDFQDLLDYCRYSANPVGRLLLHLDGQASERHLDWSDRICTALQLINFLQDLAQDYHELGRIYIPQDEMRRFGVTQRHWDEGISDAPMRALIGFQAERAHALMESGAPLGNALRGMLGFEVRMIVAGGLKVLDAISRQTNVFGRPRLSTADRLTMVGRAVFRSPPRRVTGS